MASDERVGRASVRAPEISVIVPTYNRRDVLLTSLRALGAQTLAAARFEIIVGDDGSTDGTAEAVARTAAELAPVVTYFRQANSGPGAARNRAIQIARSDLVLIMNDDTILSADALNRHLALHDEFPDEGTAVLGRVTISPEVPRSIFVDLHLDASFAAFEGREELDWRAFITANLSVKRNFLLRHGLFEESMFPHEDIELGERLRHHGLRVRYCAEAVGHHLHDLKERDFLRMAERDGRSLVRWYRKSPHLADELFAIGLQGEPPLRMRWRHRVSDLAFRPPRYDRILRLARALTPWSRARAAFVYRRLYQQARRRAVAEEMA